MFILLTDLKDEIKCQQIGTTMLLDIQCKMAHMETKECLCTRKSFVAKNKECTLFDIYGTYVLLSVLVL